MKSQPNAAASRELPMTLAAIAAKTAKIAIKKTASMAIAPLESFEAHADSRVESTDIGARTRIWAFAHILAGARVGTDCNICDHTFIERGAVVGNRVTVKCGVQLWSG